MRLERWPLLWNLQRFGEGGGDGGAADGGDGGAAAEGAENGSAPSAAEEPKLRPAEERLERRSNPRKRAKAKANTQLPMIDDAPDEGKAASAAKAEPAAEEPKARDLDAEFKTLIEGEFKGQYQAMIQKAIADTQAQQQAAQQQTAQQYDALTKAVAAKYGGDPTDVAGLTQAVNGPLKDDAYYNQLALEKGVSVETAKQIDALESENARMKAQREAAKQEAMRAQLDQRAQQIRAEWDRQAEQTKSLYPDFDFAAERQNPEFADLLRRGVPVQQAYQSVHFDDIMASRQAATAKQVEQGVVNRISQRGSRPTENGVQPGASASMKRLDVSKLTSRDFDEIEKRVARGEIINL